MLKKLCWVLIITQVSCVFAQSADNELENKYFLARNRLKKWFVTVSEKPGGGLITDNIKLQNDMWAIDGMGFDHYLRLPNGVDSFITDSAWNTNLTNNLDYTKISGFSQFDNPLIMTSEYLQVLATEYWLLQYYGKQNSEEMLACKNEIYFALLALDRLDGTAELYYDKTFIGRTYNGFLRRDDSDWDKGDRINQYYGFFGSKLGDLPVLKMNNVAGIMPDTSFFGITAFQKHVAVSREKIYIDTFAGEIDTFIFHEFHDSSYVTTDTGQFYYKNKYRINYKSNAHPLRRDGLDEHGSGRTVNEPSIDEYAGLLIGLKYIQRFVDENASAKPRNIDSAKYLVQWTRDITHRLMTYLSTQINEIPLFEPFEPPSNPKLNINLFSKGNYVLFNPMKSNKVVHRGFMAYPFGYAIEKLGEQMASNTQIQRNYPSTSLTFSPEAESIKGRTKFYSRILKYTGIDHLSDVGLSLFSIFDGIGSNADDINRIKTDCGLSSADLLNVDKICNCFLGVKAEPDNPVFWDSLWHKLGNRNSLLGSFWRKYNINAGSVNIIAAKLALSGGTWNQDDFASFVDSCGLSLMTLEYDVIHNKNPHHSQSFFKDILSSMDCLGSSGIGWPFDRDAISGAAMKPANRNIDHTYDGTFYAQTPYLIYYNLYRIAQIQYWGDTFQQYSDNSCPCYLPSFEFSKRLPYSAIEPEKIVIPVIRNGSWIKDSVVYSYANKLVQNNSHIKTKDANPSHKSIGIRQPEWLNHYYKINGNQTFEISRDLVICGAETRLDSNSTFIIDSGQFVISPNEVIVRNGGLLNCKKNSILVVNNNSRLVIDKGGRLLYSPGTRIILNGPNATLHIKGTLEIAAGATFQIEGGTSGKGYVIWENNDWWGQDNNKSSANAKMIAGVGSRFILSQSNQNQLALEVRGPQGMVTDYNLAEFSIKNCKVKLGPISRIMTRGVKTIFDNVDFEGFYGNSNNADFTRHITSMGLQILGRNNLIKNCIVNNCKQGISTFTEAANFYPLTLQGTIITNCVLGINNEGNTIRLLDSSKIFGTGQSDWVRNSSTAPYFYVQTHTGILSTGTQGYNVIDHSVVEAAPWWFDNSMILETLAPGERTYSIDYHGAGRYMIRNSGVNFADVGVRGYQGFLRPYCTKFNNNKTQIDIRKNVFFNTANNAWNDYYWSFKSGEQPSPWHRFINARTASRIMLSDGNNSIYGHHFSGNRFIDAGLNQYSNFVTSGTPSNNVESIDGTYNEYHTYYGLSDEIIAEPGMDANVNIWETTGGTHYDLKISPVYTGSGGWTFNKENYCAVAHSSEPRNNIAPDVDLFFDADPIVQSIGVMLYKKRPFRLVPFGTPDTASYLDGLDSFHYVLKANWPTTSATLAIDVYNDMHNYYHTLFADTNYLDSAGIGIRAEVYSKMLNIQNDLITRSDSDSSIWHLFKFELTRDLALIHRSFDHRVEGINVIETSIGSFADSSSQVALNEWKCILNREQMLIDSIIPYDSLQLRDRCICKQYQDSFIHNPNDTLFVPIIDTTSNIAQNLFDYSDPSINIQKSAIKNQSVAKQASPAKEAEQSFVLYPNPAESAVTISTSKEMKLVRITDAAGRQLKTIEANNRNKLVMDISDLPKGLYIVKVQYLNGMDQKWLVVNR